MVEVWKNTIEMEAEEVIHLLPWIVSLEVFPKAHLTWTARETGEACGETQQILILEESKEYPLRNKMKLQYLANR